MALSRRQFINRAGLFGMAAAAPLQALFARAAQGQTTSGVGFGPLLPDRYGLLDLPA
ncbi:MAG: phosphatase, partial [Gemmatimonadaceae bacterium]|nr:phosphatase [Gloeobacterales cyanobacterium ES-bin-141]